MKFDSTHPERSNRQVMREIAMAMGNIGRTHVIPIFAGGILVAVALKPFKDYFSGPIGTLTCMALMFAIGILVSWLLAPLNGRLILRAIERDFGPQTRKHIYALFAEARPGVTIDLDLAAIARTYGEIK
ncbi:hypothetical protein ACF8FF_07065 [Pseudomonas sp. zjy_13]|uniref:hypothetical protein n=1 Tax=Pseudomonas sp. zjy_13 TaxID=3367263 RepID=UPI00370BDAD7